MLLLDTELLTQQLLEEICFDLLFEEIIDSYKSEDIDKIPNYQLNDLNLTFEEGIAFCKISKTYGFIEKDIFIVLNIDYFDFNYNSIKKFTTLKGTIRYDIVEKLTDIKSNFTNNVFITLNYDFDNL